jgi:hypothetical protein
MGTAVRPAKTSPAPWDAFADVDVFVVELEAMAKDGARPLRSGPKPPLAGAALRKAAMAITAGRRSRASRSMLPSTNTASRWRSTSRRRTGMTPKALCRFCAPSPRVASKVRRSATWATGASGWPTSVRRSASPSRRSSRLAIPPAAPAEPWPASPADATAGSSRPASAGWLNARSPG